MKRLLPICLITMSLNVAASDTVTVEFGGSINEASGLSASVKYRRYFKPYTSGLFFNGRVSHWMESSNGDPDGTMFNAEGGYRLGKTLFAEAFIGPGWVFDPDGHELTDHLQIVSGVGIGYKFKRITPFISYHHISNGGINKGPNGGQDFIHVGSEWRFK